MNPLQVFCENARIWLMTKTEAANEVTFHRTRAAHYEQAAADATRLLAEAELRAVRAEQSFCTDLVHMRLASENAAQAREIAELRTALGEPMEAKK